MRVAGKHRLNAVAGDRRWETLLLGNGLSQNVWEPFGYRKLYDHAKDGGLTVEDRALFAGTPNFERVLGDLLTAIRVCEASGLETDLLFERYQSIQRALGHAIREVHVNRDQVPMSVRMAIRGVLEQFEWVFTTSYDLLIYWAMACGGRFEPFIDHFRYGGRCEFDSARASVFQGEIPVYFLHGALHLVVNGTGITWKLRRKSMETLLDQFGQPIEGDPQARIEGNGYLSHALGQLGRLEVDPILFFNSETHPLGASHLRVPHG